MNKIWILLTLTATLVGCDILPTPQPDTGPLTKWGITCKVFAEHTSSALTTNFSGDQWGYQAALYENNRPLSILDPRNYPAGDPKGYASSTIHKAYYKDSPETITYYLYVHRMADGRWWLYRSTPIQYPECQGGQSVTMYTLAQAPFEFVLGKSTPNPFYHPY